MTAPAAMQRTPLYPEHKALGARLVEFGGWEMPVQYSGILDEHRAVRERAGLFDVSHMGEIRVRGAGAGDFLQGLVTNDVAKLDDGGVHYTGMLFPEGGFVDDLLVYRLEHEDYLLVVNASNIAKDFEWVRSHAPAGVDVENESNDWAQLALQGPLAESILGPHSDVDLTKLASYRSAPVRVFDEEALVSRTGYTGEDGFEIYSRPEAGRRIWTRLLELGGPVGLVPVGLGARDTLRLEARLALYGNDIDATTTPLEAGLGWTVKMKKGEFIGRAALEQQKAKGLRRALAGFHVEGRGIARHGHEAVVAGAVAGLVTSGTHSPTLGRAIGLAYLPLANAAPGNRFQVRIRDKDVDAVTVPTPFYKRGS